MPQGPGVISGAFRATSRVTVTHTLPTAASESGTAIGFSYEKPTFPQQAFVGTVASSGNTVAATQLTSLNGEGQAHTFSTFNVIQWKSSDG